MKYICLGYIEPGKFERMTEDERNVGAQMIVVLKVLIEHGGHLAGEIALQPPEKHGCQISSVTVSSNEAQRILILKASIQQVLAAISPAG